MAMNAFRTIWAILTPSQKRAAIGLGCLMVVSMFLEMVGLGLVVPALGLMTSDRAPPLSPAVGGSLDRLGNPSRLILVLIGLGGLLALNMFKVAFLLFSVWRQNTFVREINDDLSQRLVTTYLMQPWAFHLQRNSAQLIRNVQSIAQVAASLTAMLSLLAECFVLVGVVALLLWFEPVGAIMVGCLLAGAAFLLERLTRRRLGRWGAENYHHSGLAHQHLQQGLGAAKEIKLLGSERTLIDAFLRHNRRVNVLLARQQFFNNVPRLWFELLAVSALCVLTLVMVIDGKTTREMIPTLGLFAMAAFRLLPSVNKLSIGIQTIRYYNTLFEEIAGELRLGGDVVVDTVANPLSFHDRVVLQGVTFCYPSAPAPALIGVSLVIPHGASVGIIGGSGAGKSTLVDVVLGLLAPDTGHVLVDGVDIGTNTRGWQRLVGYVPQSIYLSDDTIRRNVAFGVPPEDIDDAAVRRALRSAQLDRFVDELPEGAETFIGERGVRLSGGQRQRIGIARALYHDPKLLVLDEATSALDTSTEREVMRAIDDLHGSKTLLIVAHRLTTLENCDLVYQLEKGKVLRSGAYAEVVGS